jgi:hypothetical protein
VSTGSPSPSRLVSGAGPPRIGLNPIAFDPITCGAADRTSQIGYSPLPQPGLGLEMLMGLDFRPIGALWLRIRLAADLSVGFHRLAAVAAHRRPGWQRRRTDSWCRALRSQQVRRHGRSAQGLVEKPPVNLSQHPSFCGTAAIVLGGRRRTVLLPRISPETDFINSMISEHFRSRSRRPAAFPLSRRVGQAALESIAHYRHVDSVSRS